MSTTQAILHEISTRVPGETIGYCHPSDVEAFSLHCENFVQNAKIPTTVVEAMNMMVGFASLICGLEKPQISNSEPDELSLFDLNDLNVIFSPSGPRIDQHYQEWDKVHMITIDLCVPGEQEGRENQFINRAMSGMKELAELLNNRRLLHADRTGYAVFDWDGIVGGEDGSIWIELPFKCYQNENYKPKIPVRDESKPFPELPIILFPFEEKSFTEADNLTDLYQIVQDRCPDCASDCCNEKGSHILIGDVNSCRRLFEESITQMNDEEGQKQIITLEDALQYLVRIWIVLVGDDVPMNICKEDYAYRMYIEVGQNCLRDLLFATLNEQMMNKLSAPISGPLKTSTEVICLGHMANLANYGIELYFPIRRNW